MRLKNYLEESNQALLSNIMSTMANMDAKTMDYQSKIYWYDFVEFIRERGNEEKLIDFINSTFHKNIISLDDVNLKDIKP